MARFADPFYVQSFVDAMILDDVADGQDEAVAEIVRLDERSEIPPLLLAYSVQSELNNPATPPAVQKDASTFIYSIEVSLTNQERQRFRSLVDAARGEAKEENVRRDLFHVWEASKYGAGYFITRDKRLLKRSRLIERFLQIEVIQPREFLDRVAQARTLT